MEYIQSVVLENIHEDGTIPLKHCRIFDVKDKDIFSGATIPAATVAIAKAAAPDLRWLEGGYD